MNFEYIFLICLVLHSALATHPQTIVETMKQKASSSCPDVVENNLHWPETPAGGLSYPREYCFTATGIRLERKCSKDSSWEPIAESCEIQKESSLTPKLAAVDLTSENIILELIKITSNYDEMNALDIFLVSDIVSKVRSRNVTNYEDFNIILENILSVSQNVLTESQLKMRAADLWTLLIDSNFSFLKDHNIEKVGDNFIYIMSLFSQAANTLIINKTDRGMDLSIRETKGVADIIKLENFTFAVYRQAVRGKPIQTGAIMSKDWLVDDNMANGQETREVFEMYAQYSQIYSISLIYPFEDPEKISKNAKCVNWFTSQDKQGYWGQVDRLYVYESHIECYFQNFVDGFFTILYTP